MTWYTSERSLQDYEANLPNRMKTESLEGTPLANLMLRCEGNDNPDAYLAPVFIEGLHRSLGKASFMLIFVDQDLRPVGQPVGSSIAADSMWRPQGKLRIEGTDLEVRTGYFMPYEPGPIGNLNDISRELDLSRTA